VLLIVLLTIVVTVAGTYWVLTTYIFVSSFKPVALNDKEEKTLQTKLHRLGYDAQSPSRIMDDQGNDEIDESGFLKPERYTEQGARREISFTEREMNALLAKNTE